MKKIIFMTVAAFSLSAAAILNSETTQEKKEPWPGISVKVLTENEHVKISEATFAPGAVADWHSHPQHTIYALTDIKMKEEVKDKEVMMAELKAGQAMWFPAVTHKITNAGTTSSTIIVTEIK